MLIRYFFSMVLFVSVSSYASDLQSQDSSFHHPVKYPRLATLWNDGTADEKARFDLIVEPIHRIWPVQDKSQLMMAQVKALNPDILILGYFHATNTMLEQYFNSDFYDHQIIDYCWVLTNTGLHDGYGGTEINGDGISEADMEIPVANNRVFSPNQFLLIQNFGHAYEMVQVASDWNPDTEENIVRVRRGVYDQWGAYPARAHPAGTRIASIAVPFSGYYGKARAEFLSLIHI